MTKHEALEKLKKYCAYQDRCHSEVRQKLSDIGVFGDRQDDIIAELVTEDFLNEERFARSFARGRFRMKKWGRNKIRMYLDQKDISEYCKKKAMEEIDGDEYESTLRDLMVKAIMKFKSKPGQKDLLLKDAVIKDVTRKGYEAELIYRIIREMEISSSSLFER